MANRLTSKTVAQGEVFSFRTERIEDVMLHEGIRLSPNWMYSARNHLRHLYVATYMLTALTFAAQAIQIRELARRAFAIANTMPYSDDRARLIDCAEQLEQEADWLENQARSTPLSQIGHRAAGDD